MNPAHFDPHLKEKSAYKFWLKEHVRFTDLDALGHVGAVRTNEYFNSVRALFFKQTIPGWPQALQLPVLKLSVVQHDRELHFPCDIDVGMVIENWGRTSVTMVSGVFAEGCAALSRNVFVFIDGKTRTPTPPDEQIRQNFIKLAA